MEILPRTEVLVLGFVKAKLRGSALQDHQDGPVPVIAPDDRVTVGDLWLEGPTRQVLDSGEEGARGRQGVIDLFGQSLPEERNVVVEGDEGEEIVELSGNRDHGFLLAV